MEPEYDAESIQYISCLNLIFGRLCDAVAGEF